MKKFIGIELSKEHFVAAFPRDYSQKYDIKRYNHNEVEIKQFVKSLSNNWICILENKGIYSAVIANNIYKAGFQVAIVHTLQIERFAQTEFFQEKIDPVIISKYGERMSPALYKPTEEFIEQLNKKWDELKHLLHAKIGKRKKLHALENSDRTDKKDIENVKTSLKKNELDIFRLEEELDLIVNKFINPYYL
ncbi:MAG: hypothetical protein H7A25_11645 [Leptospiraceae bacterium]|nr:hypothetical protein [Leptospiraceae bacterium]MCP5500550.1 hypothetical protein [Leptospiraceae bacterium]